MQQSNLSAWQLTPHHTCVAQHAYVRGLDMGLGKAPEGVIPEDTKLFT